MTWGVVAAVAPEIGPTLRALGARKQRFEGRVVHVADPFVFALAGVGAARAGRCAENLIERFHPRVLVSSGFGGALARDLETGTIVAGGIPGLAASEDALKAAQSADPRVRFGGVVAVERVLLAEAEKEEVARAARGPAAVALAGPPLVADMESGAVGRIARANSVGFLCLKVVLDTPTAPLASRYASRSNVLRELLRTPRVVTGVLRDARRARIAGRRLADFYRALRVVLTLAA